LINTSAPAPHSDLQRNIVQFCRLLRDRELLVTPTEVIDALRTAESIDLVDRLEVKLALRTVLTARLGRGQKILTVEGIRLGPGIEGLHPVQRAFWEQGGYQCGICTRGFIMSSYALLQTNTNPTNDDIKEALGGNICRCGEYAKIYSSVHAAAAALRTPPAPAQVVVGPPPARTAPLASKQFSFVTQLGSPEFIADVNQELSKTTGIGGVSGNDTIATVSYDASVINEDQIRKALADAGYPVK